MRKLESHNMGLLAALALGKPAEACWQTPSFLGKKTKNKKTGAGWRRDGRYGEAPMQRVGLSQAGGFTQRQGDRNEAPEDPGGTGVRETEHK